LERRVRPTGASSQSSQCSTAGLNGSHQRYCGN
jgi:hypothetical protein